MEITKSKNIEKGNELSQTTELNYVSKEIKFIHPTWVVPLSPP